MLAFFAAQPRCIVALEACGGAHHWARELTALGHEVRLIPPAYVKPFVKRHKDDAVDAEAICEAAQRPTMRFVAVKSEEQQASALVFRTRDLLVRTHPAWVSMCGASGFPGIRMPPAYVLRDGWVDQAAKGVLDGLDSRSAIGNALEAVDDEIREETIMHDIKQAITAKDREFESRGRPKIDWSALCEKWAADEIEEPGGIMADGYLMRLTPEERAAELEWHHRVTNLADATPKERQAVEAEWSDRVNSLISTDRGAS